MTLFQSLNSIRAFVSKLRLECLFPAHRRKKLRQSDRRLRCEMLEDRIVPQGSFSQDFVSQVYTDLLHRTADSGGLSFWSGQIDGGQSPYEVVLSIESSGEYRTDLVEQMYQTYLHRSADPGGLSYWVGELGSESVEQVQAGIIGSGEFFDDAGGTNQGFLNALYEDVLNRAVDPSGDASFGAELNSGASRVTVAYQVLTSTEYRQDLVNSYYEQFLHRSADSGGLSYWAGELAQGDSDQGIIAGILSSTEYETRTPTAPVVTVPSAAKTVTTTTFAVGGIAEAGSLVQIFSDGSVVGSEQLVGPQTNFSITVPLTSNSVNQFFATATNAFDNQSPETAVPLITQSSATATVDVTAPAEQLNHEGDTVSLQITATDSKGNTLSYSATNLPDGLSIDSSTGLITGTVATGASDDSPYSVTVTATDTTGASGTASFTWLVDNSTDPVVTPPANQTNTEGDSVSGVTVTATEGNKNPLTYSATNLPVGLSINATSGEISGTIDAGDATSSPYTVTVSATDDLNTGSATFTWTVTAVVAVTPPSNQTNTEGDSVSGVTVTATDSKGNTVTYTASNLPAGLSINPTTGIISGTIDAGDATSSPYTVAVTASDGTYSGSATFTWTVNPVVVVTPPTDQTNTEGDTVSGVTVTATDSKGNTLTYTASNLPAGLSIDATTGVISGTVGDNDANNSPYTITVTASDGTYKSSATFTWTIDSVVVVTPPANQTNTEGDTVSGVTITATDTKGNTLTYSATNLPAGLSIGTSIGVISGTIDAGDSTGSPYTVTVTASDGTFSGTTTFTWTINPVVAITAPANQSNDEGDTISNVTVTATDADDKTLTYVASGLPAGLSIDSSTGVISGTIGANDATGSPYTVTVTASDGTFSGTATFTWTVGSSPSTPDVTTPASAVSVSASSYTISGTAASGSLVKVYSDGTVVGSEQLASGDTAFSVTVPLTADSVNDFEVTATDALGSQSAESAELVITESSAIVTVTTPAEQENHEGDSINFSILATDSEDETLSYTATGLPSGLSIDTSTGVISGTISTGDATSSPYTVTVTATDGGNSGSATFTWLVDSSTDPLVTPPSDQTNTAGDTVSGITVSATEGNSNPLTYSATNLPAGLLINATTGVISGTIDTGDINGSPYTVTVSATDGLNTGSATFTWTVNPVVVVTSPGNQTNTEGDTANVSVTATDAISDSLTYIATGLPAGLSINSSTGNISGTIAAGDASSSPYTVTIIATDGTSSGSTSFTWTINPVVVVTNPGNQTNTEGDTANVSVAATDTFGKTLTYIATGLPAGLSINSSTGAISGTIDNNVAASTPYTVTVTATDGTYSGTATFNWTINPAVVVTAPANQTASEGDSVSAVTVTATDAHSGTLTYSTTGLPAGLSINPSTGNISGTIAANTALNSPYTVTVTATDGTYSGSAEFTWTIEPVVAVTAPANQTNTEGDTVSGVTVTATDSKGNTIIAYTAKGLPTGLSIDASTGVISGTIAAGDAASSPDTVTVTATDGTFSSSATFTWTVNVSSTPVVTAPATQENAEGATVSGVQVTATAGNNAALTYSATNLPAGLTINSNTGVISGTIDTGDSDTSPYTVTVTASNGVTTGSATFTWVVTTSSSSTLPFSLTDPAWQTLPSGVRIWDVTVGTGAEATSSSTVTVNYTGYLTDGTIFDSNLLAQFDHEEPFTTSLSSVIVGWLDGIPGMKVGGERRLDIPASLAYGSSGSGTSIPPNAELVFDITLTAVS
jgi:hypothetical protein